MKLYVAERKDGLVMALLVEDSQVMHAATKLEFYEVLNKIMKAHQIKTVELEFVDIKRLETIWAKMGENKNQ